MFFREYDDGDNKYLIPVDQWEVVQNLKAIGDEDTLADLLECFDRSEGQVKFIVLEEDYELYQRMGKI